MQKEGQTWVIVAAAGAGRRFGAALPKQFAPVAGVPLLHRTLRAWELCPAISGLIVVVPKERADDRAVLPAEMRSRTEIRVVAGGERRTDSVRAGLRALPPECELVLVHDGARPGLTPDLVARVLEGTQRVGACVPVLPIAETVKELDGEGCVLRTPARDRLYLAQTPQGFRREVIEEAYRWLEQESTARAFPDDAALVEAFGHPVGSVAGEPGNVKVTVPGDLARLGLLVPRIGFGYDVHRLAAGRPLMLGGVRIPFELGLEGHSDADAPLHALADALLGAAGLPDIGRNFPNTDPRYRGAASLDLLAQVIEKVRQTGFRPSSADLTILAERPRLSEHFSAMAQAIARVLEIGPEAVALKATTGEGLGFIGRGEGIAAYAMTMLVPAWRGYPDTEENHERA